MKTLFEKDQNYTPTYFEIVDFYTQITSNQPYCQFTPMGPTDSGFPLHEIVLSKFGFDPMEIKQKNMPVLFINNGIHPGEPCGIDASMLFVRNVLQDQKYMAILDHMVIVIIPVYNIGGTLMRSSTSRANQEGPKEYGFRGNAKNYDLNRDFIKSDATNTQTFHTIFHKWDPDFFVDTHTSNGADYQYTMTLISSQGDKLGPIGHIFQDEEILPYFYKSMKDKNWEMIPYVQSISKGIPDFGIKTFLDYPRYSSGFGALNHTWSFMPEAHMLKPYKDRVYSTLAFIEVVTEFMVENRQKLVLTRKLWKNESQKQSIFHLNYKMDETKVDTLLFKGYEASYKPSEISGQSRLYYDRTKPFEKKIPYYQRYSPTLSVSKPLAYIIPQAYKEVVEKLKSNRIIIEQLQENKAIEVEKYKIKSFKTTKEAYEGHYLHSDIEVESFKVTQTFYKGDYFISTDQEGVRFIIETLEPQAPDSYFSWNFFDAILMEKEYYSAYVFEDLAVELLKKDDGLRQKFELKKKDDPDFAKDGRLQLDFIYKNSPYYEPHVKVYPVARVTSK
ncbi:MAG: M14 family zinc carboxypeptidase [Saprospiraceae bacterium]